MHPGPHLFLSHGGNERLCLTLVAGTGRGHDVHDADVRYRQPRRGETVGVYLGMDGGRKCFRRAVRAILVDDGSMPTELTEDLFQAGCIKIDTNLKIWVSNRCAVATALSWA